MSNLEVSAMALRVEHELSARRAAEEARIAEALAAPQRRRRRTWPSPFAFHLIRRAPEAAPRGLRVAPAAS